jgi:hypothetical protein
MKRIPAFLLSLFIVLGYTYLTAQAQIPRYVSYQGIILGADGKPATGSLQMTARLYDVPKGGQYLYQETQNVTLENGLFTIILGKEAVLNLPFDRLYYLGIVIDQTESEPRIPLTTAPYAFRALTVADSSITTAQLSRRGSQPGQALIATDKGVRWENVVNRLNVTENFYIAPDSGTGNVTIGMLDGSIRAGQLATASVTAEKLSVPGSPKDKQYLSYDAAGQTLRWVDGPVDGITLPYSGAVENSNPAFSVRNFANGSAGRFIVSANPANANALIAENNGTGAAMAGFATGNGAAGLFNVNNPTGTSAALRVESNSAGNGADILLNSTNARGANALRARISSSADSSVAVAGILLASAPGAASAGVRGIAQSTNTAGLGVWGSHDGRGVAVQGSTRSGVGVMGISRDSIGLYGTHTDTLGQQPAIYGESRSRTDSATAIAGRVFASGINISAVQGVNAGTGSGGNGVWGMHAGRGRGVYGNSVQGVGVLGASNDSIGVAGYHLAATGIQPAIYGESNSATANASAINGVITPVNGGALSAGIRGTNKGRTVEGAGVLGTHDGRGAGVYGISFEGTGVFGITGPSSVNASGMTGQTASPTGTGVTGQALSASGRSFGVQGTVISDSGIAIRGIAPQAAAGTAYAGFFEGKMNVTGDITKTYLSGAGVAGERRAMPIAYASVGQNGVITSGTPNMTCSWDAGARQYIIRVSNENYNPGAYVVTVTPNGSSAPLICVTGNVPNDALTVRIFDLTGQAVQANFHVMIYKP